MSSILNKAKFLLNPAGSQIAYQEDKIYPVLPKDGSADLTMFGGTGASRVSPNSTVTVIPQNVYPNSNDFDQSPWLKTGGTTLTSGQSDPFGGNNAWKIEMTSGTNNYLYGFSNPRVTNIVTISAYLRADSQTTIGFNDGAQNSNSVTIGTTWQRYTFTYTVATNAGGTVFSIIQFDNYFGVSPTQQAKTFYLYGAQLNQGPTALPYQPTTDRSEVPVISYGNGQGVMVIEPARTNLITDYRNGAYGNSPGSSTFVTAPDGTETAVRPVPNASADRYQQTVTGGTAATGDIFTYSWWYKELGDHDYSSNYSDQLEWGLTSTLGLVNCDLVNGPYFIESGPDGWTRWGADYEITDGAIDAIIRLYFGYIIGIGNNSAAYWGHQLEKGTSNGIGFASSLIPTSGSSVTRTRTLLSTDFDSAIPTGTNSAGTVFFSVEGMASNYGVGYSYPFGYFSDGTDIAGIGVSSVWRGRISSGGSNYLYSSAVSALDDGKVAIAFDNSEWKMWCNGQQFAGGAQAIAIDEFASLIVAGDENRGQDKIKTIAAFDYKLPDSELEELTTVRSGSGGNISHYGPYTIHTFKSSGTFTPSFTGEVEVLVVAGGGSGGVGSNGGGGGGAGGLVHVTSYGVSQGTGITVTVGAGGAYRNGRGSGNNGSNSVFGGITTYGGGGGGGAGGGPSHGKDGGSGGGAQYSSYGGSGVSGQGNDGGDGNYYLGGNHDAGGGGGGAGGVGLSGSLSNAGNGGIGLQYSISGVNKYYAGGGGGSSNNLSSPGPHYPGRGGLGGGGKGGINGTTLLGTAGHPNTGGGGGGGVGASGGASGGGGSGIVIVRYLT